MRSRRCTRVPRASSSRGSLSGGPRGKRRSPPRWSGRARQLDALSDGLPGALGTSSVARATPVGGDPAFGMCGRLTTWALAELILRVKNRCRHPHKEIHDNDQSGARTIRLHDSRPPQIVPAMSNQIDQHARVGLNSRWIEIEGAPA